MALIRIIIDAIIKILKYAREVYKYIGYLRAINLLNQRGGPEALLRNIIREYLINSVVDSVAEHISGPSDGDGRINSAVGEGSNLAAEAVKSFIGGDLFGTLLGAFRVVETAAFSAEAKQATKQVTDGQRIANGQKATQNQSKSGDPIILGTGEFERQVSDFTISGAGIDFMFRRVYRSGVAFNGPLGMNWDHSYNILLRQENEFVVTQLTGSLSEHLFVQHPRFGEANYNYYTPPNGVHDVLVPDNAGSFILRQPQGVIQRYEATNQAGIHHIKQIEDRFGNYLRFEYDTSNRLSNIFINSSARWAHFEYDEMGRIELMEDHAHRVLLYRYDDWSYLEYAIGPAFRNEKPKRVEQYEYEIVGNKPKLVRVHDWKRRVVVENEYERDQLSDHYGKVIRQSQNRGESNYVYERIPSEEDPNLPTRDRATIRVWEYKRNGHEIEHVLNQYGNELLRRERILEGGVFRIVLSRTRYNADGEIIARLSPDGVLTQYLFERDHIADPTDLPDIEHVLGDVPMTERMSFGNLLAEVTREKRVAESASAVDPIFWEQRLPLVKFSQPNDHDYVIKYRYDNGSQLLISKSDPRFTISADPLHVESADRNTPNYDSAIQEYIDHQRHLTKYEYGPAPRYELRRTIYPDRRRPSVLDGVASVTNIIEGVRTYDPHGRSLESFDERGYQWFNEYYPASIDPALRSKEGYLHRRLIPHLDWILTNDTPNILEIQKAGVWQAFAHNILSGGIVDDIISISAEGVRIAIYQSSDPNLLVSNNTQVAVSVDGVARTPWNQARDTSYVIEGLAHGAHQIAVRDILGIPISIGRILTHVSLESEVDNLGRPLSEIDANGNVTSNKFDALGQKTDVTQGNPAKPVVAHYEYDPAGRLILRREEWRDDEGNTRPEIAVTHQYDYDQGGLLLLEVAGSEQGGGKRVTRYRYDAEDNLRKMIDPRGNNTDIEYDTLNRQIRTIRAACSSACSITTTRYDLTGHTLYQLNPRRALRYNGYRSQGSWQSSIDTRGRNRVQTDPLGHMVVTDYDALDNPTVVRQFQQRDDGQFEMLSRHQNDYDEHGDTVRVIDAVFDTPISTTDPIRATDFEFQSASDAGTVRNAITEIYLDAHGNCVALRNPTDGLERRGIDPQGRVFDEVDPEGRRVFHIYDGNGNDICVYTIDAVHDQVSGNILHYEVFIRLHKYDQLNRELFRIDAHGNQWERRYDSLGNQTRAIDPLGRVVRFDHNSFGEEVAQIQERTQTGIGIGPSIAPFVTRWEHDEVGNVVAIVDPAQRRTEFEYDELNRLIKSRFAVGPNMPEEERSYDPANNLVSIKDWNGLITNMAYDLLNRHIGTLIDTSGIRPGNALSPLSAFFEKYKYDAAGNRLFHQNDYSTVNVMRDSRGLPISEKASIDNIPGSPGLLDISRVFDLGGRVIEFTYPSTRKVTYTYDHLGRVESVRNATAPLDYPGDAANATNVELARYNYIGHRLMRSEYTNGLTLFMQYDSRGHILERAAVDARGIVLWRLQRLRDAAGNTRLEVSKSRAGERSRKYSLDSTNRLTHYQDSPVNWLNPKAVAPLPSPVHPSTTKSQAQLNARIGSLLLPETPQIFEYDEMGNRLQTHEMGLAPIGSTPTVLNQYSDVNGKPWQYDANGNLQSDDALSFAYDHNNHVQEIHNVASGASIVSYFRDALGRVIAEITPAGSIFRLYDGTLSILEVKGEERAEFTAGLRSDIAFHAAKRNEDYWIDYDSLTSLCLLTNGAGTVVSNPSYRPFGASENGELALSPLHYGFAGMWYTPDLALYHSQTRSYRTDVGRYIQRDPIGFAGDANLYTYAGNNPISYFDPSGLIRFGDEGDLLSTVLDLDTTSDPKWENYELGSGVPSLRIDWDSFGDISSLGADISAAIDTITSALDVQKKYYEGIFEKGKFIGKYEGSHPLWSLKYHGGGRGRIPSSIIDRQISTFFKKITFFNRFGNLIGAFDVLGNLIDMGLNLKDMNTNGINFMNSVDLLVGGLGFIPNPYSQMYSSGWSIGKSFEQHYIEGSLGSALYNLTLGKIEAKEMQWMDNLYNMYQSGHISTERFLMLSRQVQAGRGYFFLEEIVP